MKQFNFTENEKNVLKAIVENAREVGDTLIEFITADVAEKLNKSKNSVNGTVSNLAKKGAVLCSNGDSYFDGEVTKDAIAWYDENFNPAKNDDFDKPVVDERIVTLNELRTVKMSSISKSKRVAAKANKYSAQFVFENWDNVEALEKYVGNEDEKIHCYKVWCIAKSRIDQLNYVAEEKKVEEPKKEQPKGLANWNAVKAKNPDCIALCRCGDFYETYNEDAATSAEILGIDVEDKDDYKVAHFSYQALDIYLPKLIRAGKRVAIIEEEVNTNKLGTDEKKDDSAASETATAAPKTEKTKKTTSEKKERQSKKYNVGDRHPEHSDWVYTEYKPGKFDWRKDKSDAKEKKSGTTTSKETKKADTKKSSGKVTKKEQTKKNKGVTVEEFIKMSQKRGGKNLSKMQADYLKLLRKGYRLWLNGTVYLLKNDKGDIKTCNIDSLGSLFKKFGLEQAPIDIDRK